MNQNIIIVADSGEVSRRNICKLLGKKGYRIYEATDGAGTIRLARSLYPNLVLIDINIWGTEAFEVAKIIEEDKLSIPVIITPNPSNNFFKKLENMKIFAYIIKPINQVQLYQTVHFCLMNSSRIMSLEKKVEKLENTLAARKAISRAKGILMDKFSISENQAYKMLRKKSMDNCTTMEKVAKIIIRESEK